MSDDLLATVRALRAEGQAAIEHGDSAQVQTVIQRALAITRTDGAPQSAAIARELQGMAADLLEVGPRDDLEALLDRALQRIDQAPDFSLGALLKIWNSQACLYGKHNDTELLQRAVDQIGQVATHHDGPVDRDRAEVFERMGDWAEASANSDFMLTLYAQAHRYWSTDPGVDAHRRAQWFNRYLSAVIRAGRDAEALAAEAADAAGHAGEHRLRAEALFYLQKYQQARRDIRAARRLLEGSVEALAAAQETDSEFAALVYSELAMLHISEPPGSDDARAAQLMDAAISIRTRLDLGRGNDFAQCLLDRALVAGRLSDWQTSARSAERAAAVAEVSSSMVTDALSLAGDAWHRLGAYDDASRCYLRAVRRRCGIADA